MKINSSNISNINGFKQIKEEKEVKSQVSENRQLASKDAANSMRAYVLPKQNISFGRKIEEHRSWGATVQQTNSDGSQIGRASCRERV